MIPGKVKKKQPHNMSWEQDKTVWEIRQVNQTIPNYKN